MAKYKVKKYKVAPYQYKALSYLKPPEKLTVSEWAAKYRMLDSKTSAIPGKWRNEQTPYLVDIMNELNNYETEEIVFVKPTQVGGTEALQNMVGYVIQQDPAPTMIVYPTEALAKSISENRIRPMIQLSPPLKQRYDVKASEMLELQFDGMYLTLEGSNSPGNLASKAIKYLFLDEVDKYPGASKKEADPISLAKERTKTFHNRKIFVTSTPTLKTGHIWKAKEDADVEKHYFVPCPHCGEYIELKWSQVRFPEKEESLSYADRAECAVYICQECGAHINDSDKQLMLRKGKWQVVNKHTGQGKKVCYWMNTLYSPFVRFADVAKEFLLTTGDPERLQNFVNSWLAEPWEDTKLKTNAEIVEERQTDLPAYVVPDWVKMLTAGVDVQENCLYWTIRGWGHYLTSQNIAHGQAMNFAEVERIMNMAYQRQDGSEMLVDLALIDSGNDTDSVYDFCADCSDWALPVKGASGNMMSHYKISSVNKMGSKAYGMQLILVDGGKYKDMIAARMRKENGKGSWMVHKDIDREYCEQVTAEHKINVKNRNRTEQRWVPKTSRANNHYLDCEVYAMAAADILGVRTLHLNEASQVTANPAKQSQQPAPEEKWIRVHENWI